MTATLDIDDLIRGVASGNYLQKPGSLFGSNWGADGLMAAEATPEQCAAFGAPHGFRLCRGVRVDWLDRNWTTMLGYRNDQLAQVTIRGEANDETLVKVCRRINPLLGDGRPTKLPEDAAQNVLRRFKWDGRDGSVTAVRIAKYLEVSIAKYFGFRRAVAWLSHQFEQADL